MPARPPTVTSTARTLHAFLIASTLIVCVGALVATRATGALTSGIAPIEFAALVMGASSLLVVYLLRSRLPPRTPGQTPDDWWRLHLGRAMLLWGLLELLALLGAVTLFATRHVIGYGLLAGLALAGLFSLSPRALADE